MHLHIEVTSFEVIDVSLSCFEWKKCEENCLKQKLSYVEEGSGFDACGDGFGKLLMSHNVHSAAMLLFTD